MLRWRKTHLEDEIYKERTLNQYQMTTCNYIFVIIFSISSDGHRRHRPDLCYTDPMSGSFSSLLASSSSSSGHLGSVFTLSLFHKKIAFLIGPEVSAHFFKASESDLSQQEVYQFNVPTFGPRVVFDVDYSIRQEQFRFFTEALRVNKIKSYVDQMVMEAEDYFSKWGPSGEVDLKHELEHLIILTASRCLLGREVRDKLFDDVYALFHEHYLHPTGHSTLKFLKPSHALVHH